MTNQLAWLELPVTPHKVNFLFVSSTLRAVAGTGRELLTKVFLTECQQPDRGGRGGGRRKVEEVEEGGRKRDGRINERWRRTVNEVENNQEGEEDEEEGQGRRSQVKG